MAPALSLPENSEISGTDRPRPVERPRGPLPSYFEASCTAHMAWLVNQGSAYLLNSRQAIPQRPGYQ